MAERKARNHRYSVSTHILTSHVSMCLMRQAPGPAAESSSHLELSHVSRDAMYSSITDVTARVLSVNTVFPQQSPEHHFPCVTIAMLPLMSVTVGNSTDKLILELMQERLEMEIAIYASTLPQLDNNEERRLRNALVSPLP